MSEGETLRLDKWLWHARFFKSRGLAAGLVKSGRCRVDGTPVSKPSRTISPGVVLTFPKENEVRVIKVLALGERRGPAPEAQALYDDLTPPSPPKDTAIEQRVGGRPTKKDRRDLDHLRGTR
ncbi:RNA-binding S4 domain-containing protein [Pseudooctadecabacter jejudonensis]|uniref:Heat shock protein 15 n=1 Tax=Pseudooctadecabacter jejudonensis TaxID=1391910 RepID=A0A1Y5RQY7_9RHOB|nr:RNA-binding S4 domain-containing protein [Pseudooctadecabacter jejudonensis]SLN22281.1 Heat shock protein 15 [Pseudooctadecabacter jejudonensis]